MALILNILLSIASVGIFAGRLYELINLMDSETNFLLYKGVVFNPYILPIFIIITVCCGILILGDIKAGKTFFAKSAGIFSVFAGVSFLIYIAVSLAGGNIESNKALSFFMLFLLLGAIGLIALGIAGLRGKSYETVIVSLVTIFCVGLCLNAIVFNVSSINNITFLKDSLSSVCVVLFFLLVFKNAYSPSRSSIMWLYITGFLCFALCGIMYMADIAYGYYVGTLAINSLFLYSGYMFIGLYAVSTAFLAIPNGKIEISIKACEPDAWNSIKMLAQTQELKISTKKPLNGIALREKGFKTSLHSKDDKTTIYNIVDEEIEKAQGEIEPLKDGKNRKLFGKSNKEKPIKEKTVKEKPIKNSKCVEKKSINTEITNSKDKIVYKKPQS